MPGGRGRLAFCSTAAHATIIVRIGLLSAPAFSMQIELHPSIEALDPSDWNALVDADYPFLRHEFLAALEHHGAVGGDSGWHPCYLTVSEGNRLLGAAPMYLKDHSFGEFVFDWAWAGAYERNGLSYYPKLVVGVPYTPTAGPRLLVPDDGLRGQAVADAIIDAALAYANELQVSSLHWLFTNERDTQRLASRGLLLRTGCQFHWDNREYRDFEEFLETFSSRRRKEVRRERRDVAAQGIETVVVHAAEADDSTWDMFYRFYLATFIKKGNYPPLTRDFFAELGGRLANQVLLILARRGARVVGGAIFIRGGDVLYGRHWGATEDVSHLHFELCYYRAIEYCIEQGIVRFEAGAQGEHKIRRGFRPAVTRSMHWVADGRFGEAISDYLERERCAMKDYMTEMEKHLPYHSAG